jgi:hypothetical protein
MHKEGVHKTATDVSSLTVRWDGNILALVIFSGQVFLGGKEDPSTQQF